MKILIDCSNYFSQWSNIGDIALYQVAGRRLSELFPTAEIRVLTDDPDLIIRHCSPLMPISHGAAHSREWFAAGDPSRWPIDGLWPLRRTALTAARQVNTPGILCGRTKELWDLPRAEAYFEALRSSDLVLLSGGGYFTDSFARHARGLLDTLAGAQRLGRPTAIMSPGFEPFGRELAPKARDVLANVDLIGCRDPRTSPKVLRSLGVAEERIHMTGDDALEIALEGERAERPNAIGFGIRVIKYANVNDEVAHRIGTAIADVASHFDAPVMRLPVNIVGPSDWDAMESALSGLAVNLDDAPMPTTPAELSNRVGRCRVVITGAFHAAVFALAAGVPVVAFAASDHYRRKFLGLADLFGRGCEVIDFADGVPAKRLIEATRRAWYQGDDVRAGLRNKAIELVRTQRAFWGRLRELV